MDNLEQTDMKDKGDSKVFRDSQVLMGFLGKLGKLGKQEIMAALVQLA